MKRVLAASLAVVTLFGSSLSVSATDLKDIFNAKYYAEQYPDLKAAFGDNEQALYQHFLRYGIKEGRVMNPIIDIVKYREEYGDLKAAFGDNWDAYVKHYFDFGVNEKRDNGTDFDLLAYIEAYGDLKETFGNDYAAIAEHYSEHGRNEGRNEGSKTVIAAKAAEAAAAAAEDDTDDVEEESTGGSTGGGTDYETNSITAYVNGTVNYVDENAGRDAFVTQLNAAISEKMGYELSVAFTEFDYFTYADQIAARFAAGEYPDVMIMNANMFEEYATTGLLWDMSEAYDNAEFQARMNLSGINESLRTADGRLYGFMPSYGNGCATYVKQAWLDAVGMKAEDIKTYDDFYAMLTAFHTGDPDGNGVNGDTYGYIAPGLYGSEAPYTNYVPEFWQDAYPGILRDDNGVWYDGFQTEKTKAALLRLQKAYAEGVIDPGSYSYGTKDAREKFWSADQTGSAGCFCYWAGSWYENLCNNLQKNGVDTDLVQLAPIEGLDAYLNREAPIWVIIDDGDGDDAREQAIFDAFIETMLDGDTVQTLWTYGAEGTHWSTKAETIIVSAGTEKEKKYEYAEGEFHCLPTLADPNTLFKKNHFDYTLVVAPLTNGYASVSEKINLSNQLFSQNCKPVPTSPVSDTYDNVSGSINDAKLAVIKAVVIDGVDVDTAMQTYVETVGSDVEQCLAELNG